MLVYVDDLLITGDDIHNITLLKQHLHAAFTIKDLGLARYFVGIKFARSSTSIILHNRNYILNTLANAGLIGAKPANFLNPRVSI